METELEVSILGGSPWGFSLKGGAEYGEPLTVHKIEAGGKADIAGQKRLKVGDEVLYINNTFCNTRLHAVQLVKSASKSLNLQVKRRESQADIVPPTEEPKTVPAQDKGSMHTESVTKVVQPSGFGGVKHRVKKRHDPPERPRSWHSTHEAINSHPDVVPDFEPMPVSSNQARYSQQRRDRAASSFDSTGRDNSMFHRSSMENMSKASFVCAQYQPPASAGLPKKSAASVYDQLSSTAGINYKDSLSTKKPEEEEHPYPRSQSLTNMKAKELQHADMRYVKTMYVPGTRPKEEETVFRPTSTSPSERKRNRSSGSSSDFQGGSNRNSLGLDIPAPPWRRSSTSPSSSSSSTTSPQLGPQSARSPPPPPVRDQSSHKAVSNMVHHSKYPSWPGPSSMLAPEPPAMSRSQDNPLKMLNTGHRMSPDYVNQEVFSHHNDQRGNHAGNGKRGSHGDQWGSFSQPSNHQRPYPQLTAVVHPVHPVQPSYADTVEIGQNGTYKVQKEGGKEMEKVEFRVQINMDGTPRYPTDRRVPSPPERDLSPEKQVSPAAKQVSPISSSRDQNLNYINNLQKKSPKYEDSGFYYEEKPTEGMVAAHNYRNERERQQGPNQWYNNKSNNHYSREFKHMEPPDHDKQKLAKEVSKPDPRRSSLTGHHSSSAENVTREEGGQKTAVQLLRSQFEDPLKTRSILRTETVNFGQPGALPGGVKKISRAQSERNLEPKWVRDMRKDRSMRNVNGGINHQDTPLIFNLFKEGKKDQDAKLKEKRASNEMLAMHAKKSTTLPENLRYNPPTFDYWRQMEKEQTKQKSKMDLGGRTDDQKVRMQDEAGYKNYLKEAQDKVLHRTSYTKTEFEHVRQRSGGSWKSGSAENLLDIGERSPSQRSPTSPTWSTGEPAKRRSGSADNLLDVVDTRVSPTRRSPTHSVSMEQLHTPVEPKETVVREARESPVSPSQSLAHLEEIKETEEHPEERKSRTVSDPQKRTKSVSAGHLRRHHAPDWEAKRQQCKSEPDLLHQEVKGQQTLDNQYGGSVTSLSSEHRSDPDGREEERMRMREALKWFYEKKTGNKVTAINRGVSTSSINSDSGYTSNRNSLASQRAASVSSLEGSRVQPPVEGTRKSRPSSGHVRDPASQQARDKAQSLPRMSGPPNFHGLQTMPLPGGKEVGRPTAPPPWKDRKASAPAHLHQTIADFRPASPGKTGRAASVDNSDTRPIRPHHGIPVVKPTPSPTETREAERNMPSLQDRVPGDRSSKDSSPSSTEERQTRVLPKEGDRRKESSPPYQEGRPPLHTRNVTRMEEESSTTEVENPAKHHPPREEREAPVPEERVQGQEPVQNAPQVEVKQRPTKETVVTITLQQKQQKPLPPVPEKEVLPNGVPEERRDSDSVFVFPEAEPTPSDRKLSNGSSGSDVFIEDSTSLRHKEALVAAKPPTRSWEEKKAVNGVHKATVRKISPLKEEPLPPPPPSPPPVEAVPPPMEFLDLPPPPPELLHDAEVGADMESPPPPPPVEDSPRQDDHRHHHSSPTTTSPDQVSPSRLHSGAMPPRTVSPSEISSPTDSSGSKTPSPPSSEHSRSSSRSSSEKSGSSDSHTVPTRDSSPSIGSSVSSLKDESERTRQPSGEKRISISPIHIRQKTPEELKTDELAKDIIDRCDDKNLKEILMEPNHKTADYMRECFPEAVQPLQPSERRRSSTANLRRKSGTGEGNTSQPLKTTRSLSETQLPPTSPYFTESSAKAKMMLEMRRQQEEEAEALEEEEDQEVLDQKKMELIDSISKKLENLRKAEDLIREENDLNNELGQQVTEWAKEMTKSNEFDKYQRFVDELDKITNLLLSLSGRLARAQNALQNIEEGTDPAEKRELQDKRDRLSDQYDDAKKLKENIDNRKDAVSKILTEYFNEEQFADFEHFIKMKSQLIMESRELDDKIKLGEEQLRCLRENLSMDT